MSELLMIAGAFSIMVGGVLFLTTLTLSAILLVLAMWALIDEIRRWLLNAWNNWLWY